MLASLTLLSSDTIEIRRNRFEGVGGWSAEMLLSFCLYAELVSFPVPWGKGGLDYRGAKRHSNTREDVCLAFKRKTLQ